MEMKPGQGSLIKWAYESERCNQLRLMNIQLRFTVHQLYIVGENK